MTRDAHFETGKIDSECAEPDCTRVPTRIGLGIIWSKRETAMYAFCDEHAAKAMARALGMKANEEGLQ